MLAREDFDGPRVWDKLGLSGYLVCLMHPNKPDRPNRPNEQDGWQPFSASCLLEAGDAVGDRILGQVGSGMNVQLLHDAGLMELHCFHRHVEDRGDRLRAAALGDKLQDFPLARGERSGRNLASLAGGWFEDQIQHIFRERRCEILLVLEDGLDRQAEF